MTANSIPLSTLIGGQPSVLGAGGNPLAFNGVMFDQDPSIPIGKAQGFANLAAVQAWYGVNSTQAALAAIYFAGFTGATLLPGNLFFMQYNTTAVAGYLRGGSLSGVALSAIQALSGTFTVSLDGVSTVSAAINLSSATSFTNAAALIQTGLRAGTPGNTATVTYDALRAAFVVTSSTTGATSAVSYATVGALATGLKLTSAAGAVTSAGAAIQTPAGAVAALVAATQNWVTCMTTWEPVVADKVAFATAINGLNQRYAYVGWDTDVTATNTVPASASFAVLTATLNGRVAIWESSTSTQPGSKAAWFCGATASINFNETNGRLDYSWQGLGALIPDVTDATIASTLQSNGYNFYGIYADGASQFQNFQPGSISGTWLWADDYINQIKITSDLRIALAQYRSAVKAVPFAQRGYNGVRAACLDPIKNNLDFGAIVAGVVLSTAQRQEINTQVGFNVADTLQAQGWYLNIVPASPSVRATRGPLQGQLYYTDGGSVRTINLASIDVQ
jgi:hypothetical protein